VCSISVMRKTLRRLSYIKHALRGGDGLLTGTIYHRQGIRMYYYTLWLTLRLQHELRAKRRKSKPAYLYDKRHRGSYDNYICIPLLYHITIQTTYTYTAYNIFNIIYNIILCTTEMRLYNV